MKKQALYKVGFSLKIPKEKAIIQTELVRGWALFQEQMLLRKRVDYQDEYPLRMIDYKLFFKERTT